MVVPQVRFFRASRAISSLTFSRDGRYLAVGERGHQPGAIVWDLNDGKVLAELKGHRFGISCLAFAPFSKSSAADQPPLLVRVYICIGRKEKS